MEKFIKKFDDLIYMFDELGVACEYLPASELKSILDKKKNKKINSVQLISGELNPYIYNKDNNTTRLFLEDHKDDNFNFKIHAGPRIWKDGNEENKMFDFIEGLDQNKKDLNIMVENKQPIHFLRVDDEVYIFDNHRNFELDRADLTMMICKVDENVENFINMQIASEMSKPVKSYQSDLITISEDEIDDLAATYNRNRGIGV